LPLIPVEAFRRTDESTCPATVSSAPSGAMTATSVVSSGCALASLLSPFGRISWLGLLRESRWASRGPTRQRLPVCPVNIDGYRAAITVRFPNFTKLEIRVPHYGLVRLPWQRWDENRNQNCWRGYNIVKHERRGHSASANFGNALGAIAGLFALVSYLCEKELRARMALPWPQMLTVVPSLSSDFRTNARPGHVLPDFAS
jgi:hypothetical protein